MWTLSCSGYCFCVWRSCGWSTTCGRHNHCTLKKEQGEAGRHTLLRAVRGGVAGFLTGIGDPSSCSCRYGAGLVSGSRCGSGWSSCRRSPTCMNRGPWISFSYSVGDVPPRGGEAGRRLMKTDTLVTSLNSQYIQEQHTWFLIQMWWIYHIIWTIRHT